MYCERTKRDQKEVCVVLLLNVLSLRSGKKQRVNKTLNWCKFVCHCKETFRVLHIFQWLPFCLSKMLPTQSTTYFPKVSFWVFPEGVFARAFTTITAFIATGSHDRWTTSSTLNTLQICKHREHFPDMDFPNFAFQNPDSRHISNEEATETTGIAFLKSLQSLNLKYANREQGGENDPKFAELIDHKKMALPISRTWEHL